MSDDLRRVCILANRYLLTWQVEAIERMVAATDVEVPIVVVNATDRRDERVSGRGHTDTEAAAFENPRRLQLSDVRLFFEMLRLEGAWAFVLAERKLSWMLGGQPPDLMQRQPVDEVECLQDAEFLTCRPIPTRGSWQELPDEIVDRIVAETDVVVRFGFGLLTGRILSEPAYGVLSFHADDIRKRRGLGPPEVFRRGVREAGATLQLLTDEVDGGMIVELRTVDVSDASTLDEIIRRVDELQIPMLAAGIEKLRDDGFTPETPEQLGEYVSTSERRKLGYALPVLVKNLVGRVRGRLRR